MNKPGSIQITIPTPCTQNWDEMAPAGQGRFCAHCSETVIDFTNYSDSALYNFFAKNNSEHVCGRFLGTQLDRNIHIPPQPHSQLYRLTVAFGLTLLFAQTPQLLAQSRPPIAVQSLPTKLTDIPNHANLGILKGNIMDDKKEPLPSAVVQVFQNGVLKGGAATDYDGNYIITPLDTGKYDVIVLYYGFDSIRQTGVLVAENKTTIINYNMARHNTGLQTIMVHTYGKMRLSNSERTNNELIDQSKKKEEYIPPSPGNKTYTREEINNSPK